MRRTCLTFSRARSFSRLRPPPPSGENVPLRHRTGEAGHQPKGKVVMSQMRSPLDEFAQAAGADLPLAGSGETWAHFATLAEWSSRSS